MRIRLILLRATSLLLFISLILRLHQLQFGSVAESSRKIIEDTVTRQDFVLPQRGEIFASDGTTLIAASNPISIVGIQADLLPSRRVPAERNAVFMRLSALLPITDTFTISPTTALHSNPQLARDLSQLTSILPANTSFAPGQAVTMTVPPGKSMAALQLSVAYSDVLTLNPGAEQLLREADLPAYLVVPIQTNVPRDVALALRENQAILPGVKVVDGYKRSYPLGGDVQSLSHLLGYTGRVNEDDLKKLNPINDTEGPRIYLPNDMIGRAGLERFYEQQLRGTMGINLLEVDAFQRTVGAPTVLRPLVNGSNLILNIDMDLQRESEAVLKKWLAVADQRRVALAARDPKKFGQYAPIRQGVIIVMDVNSGAVLASVSLPAYDNSLFTRPLSQAESDRLFKDESTPLLNRAIAGEYPPGSSFKQFTAAAALRNGVINPDTKLLDKGMLVVENKYNKAIRDIYPNSGSHPYGLINVADALKVSSNVFFNMVAGGTEFVVNLQPNEPHIEHPLEIERFHQMMTEDYGFGAPTEIDLYGESTGLIPSEDWKVQQKREPWNIGDMYQAAIGQGIVLVTPMQLLRATAATANGGTLYRPQLVKAITAFDHTSTYTLPAKIDRQIQLDPAYWAIIREGMRLSVQDPTAYNRLANAGNKPAGDILGDIDRFHLAGKTGTAQYGGATGTDRSHSWFVGFAPYDKPEIAVLALLEGTGDLLDGSGTLALPTVVDVLRAYYKQPIPELGAQPPAPR